MTVESGVVGHTRAICNAKILRGLAPVLMGCALVGLSSCSATSRSRASAESEAASERQQARIDADWLFQLGDFSSREQATAPGYDDAKWRRVDLPHDYVLEGNYERGVDDKPYRTHGYLPVKVGWYRKHLFIPEGARGKVLRLDFDGVFRDSEVWLNGQFLGRHPGGYTPFSYDVTKIAKLGGENILVVRVDPREFEGHWYEGGGIYRHVYLTALPPVHVGQWGTYVVSTVPHGEKGADEQADLTIQTTIENASNVSADCEVVSEIIAPDGRLLQTIRAPLSVPAGGTHDAAQPTVISHPQLWSLESPNLYTLRTVVLQNGRRVDAVITIFGIRTIVFDADKGLFLNGKHVRIQGAANHQDFPGVGIAVPDSLQPWRVAKLKEMGCNGWRSAHNPPNEALLDACDRLGMLVMDENRHLGDAYGHHSPPGTKADDLSDLSTMIRRDRNHPSVIMWSLCNEEGLRGRPEGMKLFDAMKKVVHRYDQTRPITSAINGSWIERGVHDEDLLGVNYHFREYDSFRKGNLTLPMFASEAMNEKTTRGEYADDATNGMCTSYRLSEPQWLAVANRPYIAGAYLWTGFDYRGEPNPHGWPDISNHTGLMDVCGFPKDKYYYFMSCWLNKPMVHLVPSTWNWPGKEGQDIRVLAFSNAKSVELFLNGKSLGIQEMPHDGHVEWQVPYAPGELSARAYTDGKTVATDMVETTGVPVRVALSVDRATLRADRNDAVVVAVSLLDDKGRMVPNADQRVTFHLTGGGRILGVGNGNPADHDTDKAEERNTFHGRCIVIVQGGAMPAEIHLTATSPRLTPAEARFSVR